jgi:hypothetical protein
MQTRREFLALTAAAAAAVTTVAVVAPAAVPVHQAQPDPQPYCLVSLWRFVDVWAGYERTSKLLRGAPSDYRAGFSPGDHISVEGKTWTVMGLDHGTLVPQRVFAGAPLRSFTDAAGRQWVEEAR